ncbi:hypothetical protein [Fibrobacter sp. UWB12]|nr:hypothetical protein [Fibrobacter sp. UWB12]SHK98439.1 hypothetical protein SAMN05720759_11140 [Fibrobacter sp. UWB12]
MKKELEQKKNYQAPKLKVVKLKRQSNLLKASEPDPYKGPLG